MVPENRTPAEPDEPAPDAGSAPPGQTSSGPDPDSQGEPPVDGYHAAAVTAGTYLQRAYDHTPAACPQPAEGKRPPVGTMKKTIILLSAVAAAVLLLVLGSVAIGVLNSTRYGPEAAVRTYLAAISQGRASQAGTLVDPGVTGNSAVLLSDDVLGDAPARMTNARVTTVTTRGESAAAEISYTVDGTAFDDVLELSTSGTRGIFFDTWTIDTPLLSSVSVHAAHGTIVSVNGTDVDIATDSDLAAYPGTYEVGPPESGFFDAAARTVTVGTGPKATPGIVELELRQSEKLTAAVQEALNAHLDACVTSTADDPEECGMYTGARYDFADEPVLAYRVETYPVVTVDDSGAYFTSDGGTVTAVATGTLIAGGTGSRSYTTHSGWGLRGSVLIDGETVTLEDLY